MRWRRSSRAFGRVPATHRSAQTPSKSALTLPRENWPRSATVYKLRRTLCESPSDHVTGAKTGATRRVSRLVEPGNAGLLGRCSEVRILPGATVRNDAAG